jgi:hypothetical protein
MTILSHRSKAGANTSGVSAEGRELTAELWVESDDPEDTGHSVIQYLISEGFTYGAPYNVGNDNLSSRSPVNTALYQIEPPQLAPGSATLWSVLLRYRQVVPRLQNAAGQLAATPISRRPAISISTITRAEGIEQAVYHGGFGAPGWEPEQERQITNSAGTPYDPSKERDTHHAVLRVTRNLAFCQFDETNFPTKWVNNGNLTFQDRVTRVVVGVRQLKFLSWSTTPRFEDGIDYVEVTFEGEIKPGSGWLLEILDTGLYELGNDRYSPDATVEIRNPTGEQAMVTTPVLLDGNGKANFVEIADPDNPGNMIRNGEIGPPHYGYWRIYEEIDIKTLGFFSGIVT